MPNAWLHSLRRRLASPDAAFAYAVLGAVAGLVTATLMILFRLALEGTLSFALPGHAAENFEGLSRHWHFLLPLLGGMFLGLVFHFLPQTYRMTGISHVIAALHSGRGRLPLGNMISQFFGALLALMSGQSGGREGPAVHVGASASSLVGGVLRLPNNSLRVLAACGVAAAIAASFNTPIAGVIFAMEVVMLEYTVAGFVPVIIAAVMATTLSQAVFGATIFLPASGTTMTSLLELPFIALLGLAAGAVSSLFVAIQATCLRWLNKPIWLRLSTAGAITGLCALLAPEVLGIGYDTLQGVLAGQFTMTALVLILGLKLLATATACGLGMPIGVVGPSLLIGAFVGAGLGTVGTALFPELSAGSNFYVLLGMAACMGAILNAPLAALLAIIELTHNLNIIFPAMLAVIAAQLVHRELFGQQSSPQATLTALSQSVRASPLTQALLRTSAAAIMDRNIRHVNRNLPHSDLAAIVDEPKRWLVITNDQNRRIIVHREHWFPILSELTLEEGGRLDLLATLDNLRPTATFDVGGTLLDALHTMNDAGLDSLFVSNAAGYRGPPDEGVITREALSDHYNLPIRF
ncbi:chloride channel protein [Spongiibacter nanhainus]|uniref:Chloride channel protein n=1 Tax=Spongiibacter nanhainus TaxID=2794344 RepID=A0A7T4URV6_9GAMM|nr:chloride channel protein [Spongiibacter nanhainus]QQD18785.1 chloride channel protein [Spongiibacter nanhainus]